MTLPTVIVEYCATVKFLPSGGEWIAFDGVKSVNISRGRPTELDEFRAGTCSITLDGTDRAFDPYNGASGTAGDLVPDTPIRVRTTSPASTLFTGYLDDGPTFGHNAEGGDPVVQMQASDLMRVFSQAALADVDFPQEFTRNRFIAVCDAIGLPAGLRYSPSSDTECAAVEGYTGGALEMIRAAERTEAGAVFVEDVGLIDFWRRRRLSGDPGYNLEASYGPADGGTYDAIYEGRPDPVNPTWITFDRFIVQRDGGEPQSSATSSGNFLAPRVKTVTGTLHRYDEEAEALAQWLAAAYETADPFPASITFQEPQADWAEVLNRELQHRVEVDWYPFGASSTVTDEVLIDSVNISSTPDNLVVTFGFGGTHAIDYMVDGDWFELDNSTLNSSGHVLIH